MLHPQVAYVSGFAAALAMLAAETPRKAPPKRRAPAGAPQWRWTFAQAEAAAFNPVLAAREAALTARGFSRLAADADGYAPWVRGGETLILGPFGAVYTDAVGWSQMPRDARDDLTAEGAALLAT